MHSFVIPTVILALISQVAAQCSTTQSPNCVSWVANGFCNNTGYTLAMRQQYCGISCGLCNAAGQPITPGVCAADANANCATWAANGFCTNPGYTAATIQAYCCKTCAPATTTTAGTTTTGSTTTTDTTTTTTTTVAPPGGKK